MPIAPPPLLTAGSLPTALAPMQDVTDLPFMQLLGRLGKPDYFFTEYFRVHDHSTLEKHIVAAILHHGTDRPVFAQMIGEDLVHLRRTALELQQLPVAGIDLNMGCPAPKVYRKNVGGGLLRDPATIERIFATLRSTITGRFTVKMRIGFEDDRYFDTILALVAKHGVDLLSLHGRTVKQMYRGDVDYARIRHAVECVPCPVLANGNITSADSAIKVQAFTGAFGVMIGRSAIRNPWVFRQIREQSLGQPVFQPLLHDVRAYIDMLWEVNRRPHTIDAHALPRMKKFLNFIGQAVDPDGEFLNRMRRATDAMTFFAVCDAYLLDADRDKIPFPSEPFAGVIARPNAEDDGMTCSLNLP